MRVWVAAALLASAAAQAQPTAPATAAGARPVTRQDLIQRVLVLQQPALESLLRSMSEQPARLLLAQANELLQTQVPAARREAAAKRMETAARQYQDEVNALAHERAGKLGQTGLAPVLDSKFNDEELRQLVAALDAPAYKKFQQSLPELTTAFAQKAAADLRPALDPKVKTLDRALADALDLPAAAIAQAASAAKTAQTAKPVSTAAPTAASASASTRPLVK